MNIPEIDFSKSGTELLAAFVKFSGDVGNVEKNKDNPHFKSTYADLAAAMTACREHLAKHELAVMQHPFNLGDALGITTLLIHVSGQYLSSNFILRPVKHDPQSAGSAVTYARRYAYMAILGIAPEDDDGNAAAAKQQGPQQIQGKNQQQGPKPKGPVPESVKPEFFNMEDDGHMDRLDAALTSMNVPKDYYVEISAILHGKDMIASSINAAIKAVKDKRDKLSAEQTKA